MKTPAGLCVVCKSARYLCGQKPCPLLARIRIAPEIDKKIGLNFFGPSPSIFVGRVGYPKVNIGPLGAIELRENLDSPQSWLDLSYSDIVELRSLLLRSKSLQHIKQRTKFVEENKLLAAAKQPTDVELTFKKKPVYKVSFSDVVQPMGPHAQLQRMKITENVRIDRTVDRVLSDDMKAYEAVDILYRKDVDIYRISTILSSGSIGLRVNQKLVPTRWSITATDDILTKQMLSEIRTFPSVNEFQVFEAKYFDNHFVILLMPGNFEYEGFEAWAPGSFWSQNLKAPEVVEEYESYKGRKNYAAKQGGGYYAARFAIVEYLYKIRRQACVVAFREIGEGYVIPLGVWTVRETARKAMQNKVGDFSNLNEALAVIRTKLRLPLEQYKQQSILLEQKRLVDWF